MYPARKSWAHRSHRSWSGKNETKKVKIKICAHLFFLVKHFFHSEYPVSMGCFVLSYVLGQEKSNKHRIWAIHPNQSPAYMPPISLLVIGYLQLDQSFPARRLLFPLFFFSFLDFNPSAIRWQCEIGGRWCRCRSTLRLSGSWCDRVRTKLTSSPGKYIYLYTHMCVRSGRYSALSVVNYIFQMLLPCRTKKPCTYAA